MTEGEWLACGDPAAMVTHIVNSPRATERTLRLYVAAFWGWQSVRIAERDRVDLQQRVMLTERWAETGKLSKPGRRSRSTNVIFYNRDAKLAATMTADAPRHWRPWGQASSDAVAVQADLLRDIFGNPFRPVTIDPSWLTSDVVALARGIYEERAFDRLPILADALMDAGCDSADILDHCRGDGPHVRGCWVVDLMLGKT